MLGKNQQLMQSRFMRVRISALFRAANRIKLVITCRAAVHPLAGVGRELQQACQAVHPRNKHGTGAFVFFPQDDSLAFIPGAACRRYSANCAGEGLTEMSETSAARLE